MCVCVLGAGRTDKPQNLDGEDFSNYFCAYGFLYNQKEMLEDSDRMQAYYESIIGNHRCVLGYA